MIGEEKVGGGKVVGEERIGGEKIGCAGVLC